MRNFHRRPKKLWECPLGGPDVEPREPLHDKRHWVPDTGLSHALSHLIPMRTMTRKLDHIQVTKLEFQSSSMVRRLLQYNVAVKNTDVGIHADLGLSLRSVIY